MKHFRMLIVVCWVSTAFSMQAWQGQAEYDATQQSYTVHGNVAFDTNNTEGGKVTLEKDIPILHLSNAFSLETKDLVSDIDANIEQGGSVEIRMYLYNPVIGEYDQLLWGVKKDNHGLYPTQSGIAVTGGIKGELNFTTDSRDFMTLLSMAVPALESSLDDTKSGQGVAELFFANMQKNILTYNGLLRPLIKSGMIDQRTFGYSKYTGFAGMDYPEAITYGTTMPSLPIQAVIEQPEMEENDLELKLGTYASTSFLEEMPFLGLQKVRLEMDVTNAEVRSFTVPNLGFFTMSVFAAQDQKLSFRQVDEHGNPTDPNQVLVSAHRGYWRNAPPNSLVSMEEAIAKGSQIVEFDLNRTKDGKVILMHDPTINRTTNYEAHTGDTKNRKVAEMTLDEIRELKLVDRFGKVYLRDANDPDSYEKVPTLEEALSKLAGRVVINIDKYELYFAEVWDDLLKTGSASSVIGKGYKSVAEWEAYLNSTVNKDQLIPTGCMNQWDDPSLEFPVDPEDYDDDCPARVGDKVLGNTPAEKLDFMLKSLYFTPILNDWVVRDGHSPSFEQFIEEWTAKDIVGFETMPETMNTPVWEYMRELSKDYMVGTFSPFADTGEGHSISKGRAKFDAPFTGKTQWDLLVQNNSNFLINDRSGLLDQYIAAIGLRNKGESSLNTIKNKLHDDDQVMVVAHRAAWRYAQENSLAAMREAVNMGADILEMDVRMTLDDQPMINHDYNLRRTTTFKLDFGSEPYMDGNGYAVQDQYTNNVYVLKNVIKKSDANGDYFEMKNTGKRLETEFIDLKQRTKGPNHSDNNPQWILEDIPLTKAVVETDENGQQHTVEYLIYTSEMRHWHKADIDGLRLLDRYGNPSSEKIMHLENLLSFVKDKAMVSIDKWNNCPVGEESNNPNLGYVGPCSAASAKKKLHIILKTADKVGALSNLVMGDLTKPDYTGSCTKPVFENGEEIKSAKKGKENTASCMQKNEDFYTIENLINLFTFPDGDQGADRNYLKEIGSWMPRLSNNLFTAQSTNGGIDPWDAGQFVDNLVGATYTDDNGDEANYPVNIFMVKLHEVVANTQHTQVALDDMRRLIAHIRSKDKHVYMAATMINQTLGYDHTDLAALDDPDNPDKGWLWLMNKAALVADPGAQSQVWIEGPGASTLETNYPLELLRFLRSRGLHN